MGGVRLPQGGSGNRLDRGSGQRSCAAFLDADCALPPGDMSVCPYMPLINVVLTLIVVGVLLWLINTYIPMQGTIKSILNIVVVIAVVLWLLYGFGIITHSGNVVIPVVK
jgi:hypothetical protein